MRPQRMIRAFDDEWDVIRSLALTIRKDGALGEERLTIEQINIIKEMVQSAFFAGLRNARRLEKTEWEVE